MNPLHLAPSTPSAIPELKDAAILRAPTPEEPESETLEAENEDGPRGRLKRRRQSTHSPPRATSPSRGHDRASGSRHRHHYRKHQRAMSLSTTSSITPRSSATPPLSTLQNRRSSDAHMDHTLRGRVRERSWEARRTRSPVLEGEEESTQNQRERKRSPPPSRHRSASQVDGRRQRSLPNIYQERGGEVKAG